MKRLWAGVCVLLTVLQASAAEPGTSLGGLNLKPDAAKPLNVTADRLAADDAKSQAVFSGNVVAVQDAFRLGTDTLTVFYDKKSGGGAAAGDAGDTGAIKRLEAVGNVRVTSSDASASGNRGDYDPVSHVLNLYGNVVLTQNGRVIRGEHLTANTEKSTAVVTGAGASKRVQVLLPGQDTAAKATPASAKKKKLAP